MLCRVFLPIYLIKLIICGGLSSPHVEINGVLQEVEQRKERKLNYTIFNGTYQYFDGQLITLSCFNSESSQALRIKANVYSLGNTTHIETKPIRVGYYQKIPFMLKLTKECDNKYLACEWINMKSNNQSVLSVTKMVFKLVEDIKIPDPAYLVNGFPAYLTTCSSPTKQHCYKYEGYATEKVLVELYINGTKYKTTKCGQPASAKIQNNQGLTLDLSKKIQCFHKTDQIQMELTFLPNPVANDFPLVMKGLTMSRTSALYYRDLSSIVIIYEYFDGDQLDLQCVSKNSSAKWVKDDRKIYFDNKTKSNSYIQHSGNAHSVQGSFKLKTTQETTMITCNDNEKKPNTITIFLKIKQGSGTFYASQTSDGINGTVIGVTIAILVAIIIAAIIIVVVFIKYRRNLKSVPLLRNMIESPNKEAHNKETPSNRNIGIHYSVPAEQITSYYVVPYQASTEDIYSKPIDSIDNGDKHEDTNQNEDTDIGTVEGTREHSQATRKDSSAGTLARNNEVTYAVLSLNPPSKPFKSNENNDIQYAELSIGRS